MLIDLIVGARPNFVKVASLVHAFQTHIRLGGKLRYRLIHTGQHYDSRMSDEFFQQLNIPTPDANLEVGSGTQAEQTAAIMTRYEKLLSNNGTNLCLVVGDVTSSMACAITAQKLQIPVAHVEAGIRSGDWTMPEEINRILTDAISNWFFTTSITASNNLILAGVDSSRVFFVGNTMIDTLLANLSKLRRPAFWNDRGLSEGSYFVVTLHRPSNVDRREHFFCLLNEIGKAARGLPVVFPAHPRTAKTLRDGDLPANIHLVDPQPYLEFNYLVKNAKAVITDSGGVTEEATVLGVPCFTMRDSTERPETVTIGTNELIGTDPKNILIALDELFSGKTKQGKIPEKWDGNTSERIVSELERLLL